MIHACTPRHCRAVDLDGGGVLVHSIMQFRVNLPFPANCCFKVWRCNPLVPHGWLVTVVILWYTTFLAYSHVRAGHGTTNADTF